MPGQRDLHDGVVLFSASSGQVEQRATRIPGVRPRRDEPGLLQRLGGPADDGSVHGRQLPDPVGRAARLDGDGRQDPPFIHADAEALQIDARRPARPFVGDDRDVVRQVGGKVDDLRMLDRINARPAVQGRFARLRHRLLHPYD